jgi:uncharacterized protein (DUF1697 family)
MTRYALLLRGVNVGANNSLPMSELRKMLETIGASDVQTYVQSGNAVFGTERRAADLTQALETSLAATMGRPIATTLRTLAQMRAVVLGNPFVKVATNPTYLCVTFLSQAPKKSELALLLGQDFTPELFHVSRTEIYSWHPNGQGRSALAHALQSLPLRGTVTTRNWKTVLKLLNMLGGG